MLEQCCNYSKQCCNNIATLCWAKNSHCESSLACVASVSVWFGSKEIPRSRNRILGFGRARNETSAKKFFSRSLTLVLRSLLLNRTETPATQAKSSRLVMRAIFRICGNESQPGLHIVEMLATPSPWCGLWGTGYLCAHVWYPSAVHTIPMTPCYDQFSMWRLSGRNGEDMFTVTYWVSKVWTQHCFALVLRCYC